MRIITVVFILAMLMVSLNPVNTSQEKLNNLSSDYSPQDNIQVTPALKGIPGTINTRGRYLDKTINLDDEHVQLTLISGDAYDNSYGNNIRSGSPIATGDIDNDGYNDLIFGCPFSDGLPENRWNTGQVIIMFGGTQTHPNTIYDQALQTTGEIDILIDGADNSDLFGGVVVCGDIDGDAYDDLILAAPFGDSDSNSRGDAGEVYVIFGAARDNLDSYIDLRATAPDIMIYGAAGGDRAGFSLALGNVIGDNNLDIIIGAKLTNPEGRVNAGTVYVIAGGTRSQLGKNIDLSVAGSGPSVKPEVRIDGVRPDDRLGFAVAAGDINADGRDDIIMGARHAQYNSSFENTGVTYVVYGRRNQDTSINLTTEADVYIYGADSHDNSGWALTTGNINGDEYEDIFIGAPYADGVNNGQRDAGETYVIYGKSSFPRELNMSQIQYDIIIYGVDAWDNFGFDITTGSVNGDQYDDFMMGARGGNGEFNDIGDCGDSYLILGNTTAALGDNVDLITETDTTIFGIDSGDNSGRFVHLGDIDGDSADDIFIGAPYADGPLNARDSCGEYYVIYSGSPPVNNEFLGLMDGDYNNKTVFSKYRDYTFRVKVSNILGYTDFESIILSIDPDGYNVSFEYSLETELFTQIHGPFDVIDCISTISDIHIDGLYNFTLDFKLIFNWNFSTDNSVDCRLTTVGVLSKPDVDTYIDVFEVNSELRFVGELKVKGKVQGKIQSNAWVSGGEEITFSGLKVVYSGTTDYYPPSSVYSLRIYDNTTIWSVPSPQAGAELSGTITTPELSTEYYYHLHIVEHPAASEEPEHNITLKIDHLPPEQPTMIALKADTQSEPEVAVVDDDSEIFVSWPVGTDHGSGVEGYYYSFSDGSGTMNGVWTTETTAKIKNASEGVNSVYVWSQDNVGNIGDTGMSQIFVDLTRATFENFTPESDEWFTSNIINCSIQVFDRGGFGVDIENITYLDILSKKWLPVQIDDFDNQSYSFVNVSANALLTEGGDGFVQFRATDRAGNGPAESDKYYFKIDISPVSFTKPQPSVTDKQITPKIRCYITLDDSGGSGVDLDTIQYSYTRFGLGNFSEWSSSGLALEAPSPAPEVESTWFVDLTFRRGGENYIRWRAMDIAGNGYTISENYPVLVNALPEIVIKGVDVNGLYDIFTDIEFNAENTTDADNTLQDKHFLWSSNISGEFGTGKVVVTSLPAGRHLITLMVYDGTDYATEQFNITVFKPKAPKKEEDKGMFGISKSADSIILSLIVLILIIVILFFIIYTRENRMRKRLEGKALGADAVMSRFRQVPPVQGRDMQGLSVPDGRRAPQILIAGGGDPAFPPTGSPYSASTQGLGQKQQGLPGVGGTVGGPTVAGRPLPQLPPARIRRFGAPAQPDMKLEIDVRKKLELLEKKMLVGEVSVGLYEKLSKKYEQELENEKEKAEEEANEPKDITNEDKSENEPVSPKPTLSSGVGVTPDKLVVGQVDQEPVEISVAPEKPVKPMISGSGLPVREPMKPSVIKKPVNKTQGTPTIGTEEPELGLTPEAVEQRQASISQHDETQPEPGDESEPAQPKKKKKKKKKKAGFEAAEGFSEDEMEFLKNLRNDSS
jgi:hypothetical protein